MYSLGSFIKRIGGLAAYLSMMSACTPALHPSGQANVSVILKQDRLGAKRGVNKDSGLGLTPNLCYALHVVASDLQVVSTATDPCGPPQGLGQLSTQAYDVGATASMSVAIGYNRHFELIALKPPSGDPNGVAVCGNLGVRYDPTSKKITYSINGQDVEYDPVLMASGDASQIVIGDNIVTLQALPLVSSEITTAMDVSFGTPYFQEDLNSPPAACSGAANVNPSELFTVSGAAVVDGPLLNAVSTTTFPMTAVVTGGVVLPVTSSTTAGAGPLYTGILAIKKQAIP